MTQDLAMTPEIARLTVELDALKANYKTLQDAAPGARMSAVVKSNGYGLGAEVVAKALEGAGCDLFFTTRAHEGADLRRAGIDADIYILDGLVGDTAGVFHRYNLIPVLNSLAEIHEYRAMRRSRHERLRAAIHLDTGMHRLGLPGEDLDQLVADLAILKGIDVTYWMSHLASSEDAGSPVNTAQLDRFKAALARLPAAKASLANSGGVFLGPDYQFDLCRPGIALYGCPPGPGVNAPLRNVATAEARILQVQDLAPGESAGYGATWTAKRPTRLATLALGYADGYPWSLGNKGHVFVGGTRAPVVGRVSMDLITVDMTDVPAKAVQVGGWAEVMGANITPQELAQAAGTIPYELFTSLGKRYLRRYI
jgi:alanine racemase